MELESLRIFRNVVDVGGFSKAVSRCHLSQPAISKQIQALENSLGQKLIARTTQTFELTPAGKLLYDRSEKILSEMEETKQLLKNVENKIQPTLRIGTTASIGISYFRGIFTNFTKHNPRCRLDVQSQVSPELIPKVEVRELDLAVICLPPTLPKNVVILKTFLDPMILVASDLFIQKEKQRKRKFSQLLQNEPLILISGKTYTRKIIDHFLFEQGLTVAPKIELDSFDLIVSFVSLSLGISIVPQRVLPVYSRSRLVSFGKLANLNLKRELGVVVHKDNQHKPLIKEFIHQFSF